MLLFNNKRHIVYEILILIYIEAKIDKIVNLFQYFRMLQIF